MPAAAARSQVLHALVPDSETLDKLDRLHAPWYRRATQRLRGVERSALALATLCVVTVQTVALLRVDLLRDPSPFLWPVIGLSALLFAAVGKKAFDLWIKGHHPTPDPGLDAILGLASATLLAGLGGTTFDLYRLAGTVERTPELAEMLTSAWFLRDSPLLSVSILLALVVGLAWFVLSQWSAVVAGSHRDVLGLGTTEQLVYWHAHPCRCGPALVRPPTPVASPDGGRDRGCSLTGSRGWMSLLFHVKQ